eukprot:g9783.t1
MAFTTSHLEGNRMYLDLARNALEEFRRQNLISIVGLELLDHLRSSQKHAKQVPKPLRHLYFPPHQVFTDASMSNTTEITHGRVLRIKQVRADLSEEDLLRAVCRVLVSEIRDESKKRFLQSAFFPKNLCTASKSSTKSSGGSGNKKKQKTKGGDHSNPQAVNAFSTVSSFNAHGMLSDEEDEGNENSPSSPTEEEPCPHWFTINCGKMTKEECQSDVRGEQKEVISICVAIEDEELVPCLNVGYNRWDRAYDKQLCPAKGWKLKCDWGRFTVIDEMQAVKLHSAVDEMKANLAKRREKELLQEGGGGGKEADNLEWHEAHSPQ